MPRQRRDRAVPRRVPRVGLGVLLVSLAAACAQQSSAPPEERPSEPTAPESGIQTYDPSRPPADSELTVTIEEGNQQRIDDWRITVSSVREGEVGFTISSGPGIERDDPQSGTGTLGDRIRLDNGYTVTIDEVEAPGGSGDASPPEGTDGYATLTIAPPQ